MLAGIGGYAFPRTSTATAGAAKAKKKSPADDRDEMAVRALDDEFASAGQRETDAAGTRGEALEGIRSFDPMSYARTTGEAIYADTQDQRNAAQYNRGASLNSRGLFGSNIGGAREGRHFQSQFARALAGLGMDAGRMEGENIDRMSGMAGMDAGRAESGRNRALDFLSGERDRDTADENAKRMAKAQKDAQPKWWEKALGFGLKAADIFMPG